MYIFVCMFSYINLLIKLSTSKIFCSCWFQTLCCQFMSTCQKSFAIIHCFICPVNYHLPSVVKVNCWILFLILYAAYLCLYIFCIITNYFSYLITKNCFIYVYKKHIYIYYIHNYYIHHALSNQYFVQKNKYHCHLCDKLLSVKCTKF